MQREFAVIVHDRVACVRPALKTYDDVGLFSKHIRDLAFTLIAPVRTNYCSYHVLFLLRIVLIDMIIIAGFFKPPLELYYRFPFL